MATNAFDYIQIGRIIYIEDKVGRSWPFVVATISKEGVTLCQAVGRKSTPMQIRDDNTVMIVIPNHSSGAFRDEAIVLEKNDSLISITLQLVGTPEHVQRREYFRTMKPPAHAVYQFIERGVAEHDVPEASGRIWDLSGNGIGIIVSLSEPPSVGCKALLRLSIDDGKEISIIGEVVRLLTRCAINREYLIGIHFRRIGESDRRRVVQFVTQAQLNAIRPKKKSTG